MYDYLINEVKKRQEVFRNLDKYLRIIKDTVRELDQEAEVYLIGSVAEGTYTLSSDIDVLIITRQNPGVILKRLWEVGIRDPFEVHVRTPDKLKYYSRLSKIVKV